MIKKTAKFIIPSKAWNILRYIKHNPNAVRQGWHVLKKQGVKAVYDKSTHLYVYRLIRKIRRAAVKFYPSP